MLKFPFLQKKTFHFILSTWLSISLLVKLFPSIENMLSLMYVPLASFKGYTNHNGILYYIDSNLNFPLNFSNILLASFSLLATIILILSKGKELRLYKFIISIFLIDKIFLFFYLITYLLTSSHISWFLIAYIPIHILWTFLFYFVLKHTNLNHKEISLLETHASSNKSTRFINHIVDLLICSLLGVSTFFEIFQMLKFPYEYTESKLGLLFTLAFTRVVYYLFFETIFHTSPGKIITNSFLSTTNQNEPITSHKVFMRTIYRFIPFEPVSFLTGGKLHDNYSNTTVLQLNKGSKLNHKYRWLFVYLIFVGLIVFGIIYGTKELEAKKNIEVKALKTTTFINNLSKNDVLHMKRKGVISGVNTYLIVDTVINNSVILKKLDTDHYISNNEIVNFWKHYKEAENAKSISIKKHELLKSFRNTYFQLDIEGLNFRGTQLLLINYYSFNHPIISINGSNNIYNDDYTVLKSRTLFFENHGWKGELIEIRELLSGITIDKSYLPSMIDISGKFSILINFQESSDNQFSFEIDLANVDGVVKTYICEGDVSSYTLRLK